MGMTVPILLRYVVGCRAYLFSVVSVSELMFYRMPSPCFSLLFFATSEKMATAGVQTN